MAAVEQRGNSWRATWRLGGTRKGKWQSASFEGGNGEKLARQAHSLAKAYKYQKTRDEILAIIYDLPPEAPDGEKPKRPTVKEFAPRWLKSRTRLSPGQRANYQGQLDRVIFPAIGHLPLDEVTGTDIAAILTGLQARFADRTVTRYYACIHAMFAFAVREKLIDDNPAARTDYVRDIVNDPDDDENHCYLQIWELDRIVDSAAEDIRDLVEFMAGTGTRVSEATAVEVGDVDLDAKPPVVWVRTAWKYDGKKREENGKKVGGWRRGKPKNDRKRAVTLGPRMVEILTPRVKDRPRRELLFLAPEGGRWIYGNLYHRRWEPAMVAAMRCAGHPPPSRGQQVDRAELAGPRCRDNGGSCGRFVKRGWNRCHDHLKPEPDAVSDCDCPGVLRRRPTPHDLRHSHVAWCIEDGMHLKLIAKRIGHQTTAVTERVYAGILPQLDEDSAGAFDRARIRDAERGGGAAPSGGAADAPTPAGPR